MKINNNTFTGDEYDHGPCPCDDCGNSEICSRNKLACVDYRTFATKRQAIESSRVPKPSIYKMIFEDRRAL